MTGEVIFDPLVPLLLLWAAAALAALMVGFALWRGLAGWWLRGLAAVAILAALANPSLQTEERTPLSDIVVLVVDESASQRLADRPDQTARAVERVRAEVAALDNTELRIVRFGDGAGDEGTMLMTALSEALAEVPRSRLAGAILLTDGQLHDLDRAPSLPAPLHALLTGQEDDWDRRLVVRNAPAFAILGEEVTLTLKIEDQGAVPETMGGTTSVAVSVDGGEPQSYRVPIGEDLDVPVVLDHAGRNVIQFSVAEQPGELTDRNNAAVVQINGVRDRLRVLLVSGEPHPGERTWRNLLKSDSSVDLVHFTILRPPDKHDGVPVSELSLIAFPTRELFLDKIDEFDLIIFDRYKRRGILPAVYFDNVRNYVEKGGALLIAAGPDFAGAESIYRSPLADILPAEPSARVIEQGYRPEITDLGQRHPVTEGLKAEAGGAWGRWFRLIDLVPKRGEVVMSGIDDRPLLVLDRVGEGRVALLGSDHAWLWTRGFEGGGPQLELLRRLAHWMMKEPELEEEALSATAEGQVMTVTRRSLSEEPRSVEIARPDGGTDRLELTETAPGRFTATYEGPEMGLYRLTDGTLDTVIALGPAAPREFEETIASGARLDAPVAATRGGILPLHAGMPDLRTVREGRRAHGRGWLGITPRGAYLTSDVTVMPLAPAWAFLLLAALLSVGAWLREGRR
ncbi:hypothetical protein DSD19_15450 [Rhodovulum sp. BSW8]|uniref:glutamine amidotransferase n=1 Tax=Rhodovulum sp. BSW8 TaxID=2259645 RepID=UPI000DE2B3C4|nr:glutamine amidotransferase [Rhodovulum sp. BSW8]RBO52479.1 hypothetical protein DSD19_15450 [Rhodovulum sp. BSW8]